MTHTITTLKGSFTGSLAECLLWQEEHQGAMADIDGIDLDELRVQAGTPRSEEAWWSWHDADQSRWSSSTEEAEQRCAAWVAGESDDGPDVGDDHDTGRIESIDGDMAYVAWDSGVKTPCPLADLRIAEED